MGSGVSGLGKGGSGAAGAAPIAPAGRFKGNMSNSDVTDNVLYAIRQKDTDVMRSVLEDIREGDIVSVETKTRSGRYMSASVMANNDGSFRITTENSKPITTDIDDAVDELLYIRARSQGSRLDASINRANPR